MLPPDFLDYPAYLVDEVEQLKSMAAEMRETIAENKEKQKKILNANQP